MSLKKAALLLILPALGISCGPENAPPENPSPNKAMKETPAPRQQTGPSIPKDARWTVLCAVFRGPDHIGQAKAQRQKLLQTTSLTDWYIVSAAGETTLYYGFYRTINDPRDPAEAARAQNDRKRVQQYVRGAMLVEIDSADGSPPEWDLTRTPTEMLYTVQVGVYKDHPDRKAKAVDAVREARAMGIDAFYFHGPTASSVCIGLWPENSVKENNKFRFRAPMEDAHEVPVVVPAGVAVPEGAHTRDGRPIEVVRPSYEVLDPKLMATLKKYDVCSINGQDQKRVRDERTGMITTVRKPSFIARIPGRKTAEESHYEAVQGLRRRILSGQEISDGDLAAFLPENQGTQPVRNTNTAPAVTPGPTVAPTPLPIPTKQPAKGGKLKSIED